MNMPNEKSIWIIIIIIAAYILTEWTVFTFVLKHPTPNPSACRPWNFGPRCSGEVSGCCSQTYLSWQDFEDCAEHGTCLSSLEAWRSNWWFIYILNNNKGIWKELIGYQEIKWQYLMWKWTWPGRLGFVRMVLKRKFQHWSRTRVSSTEKVFDLFLDSRVDILAMSMIRNCLRRKILYIF